jgi:tRNA A37 threonylcarbamoyladenosine synthetase subunit TsaC/SUA5/YrdC
MTNIATCYSKKKNLIATMMQITQTMQVQCTQMKLVVTNSPSCLAIVHTINFTLHITSINLKGPATSKAQVSNIFSRELLENGWNSKPNLRLQQKAER